LSKPLFSIWEYGLFFSVVLSLSLVSCVDFLSSYEITAYPLHCDTPVDKAGRCNGKLIQLNRTIYKVFPETQQVIIYHPDSSGPPMRARDCAVFDKRNWRCTYSDKSGSFGCNEGRFYEDEPDPRVIYVSKWRYWFIALKAIFG